MLLNMYFRENIRYNANFKFDKFMNTIALLYIVCHKRRIGMGGAESTKFMFG